MWGENMRKTAYLAMLTACALIVSYIESVIPMPIPVPGIKLGLANIVTLFLIIYGKKADAALVLIARTVLSSLLFATPINLLYSLGGGLLALLTMSLLSKAYPKRISLIGISVGGACAHNIGQVAVACIILRSASLINYLPVLLVVGLFTGAVIALLGAWIFPRVSNLKK